MKNKYDFKNFGKNLKTIRTFYKELQKDVAKTMDSSVSVISRIENGVTNNVNVKELIAVTEYYYLDSMDDWFLPPLDFAKKYITFCGG